MALRPAWLALGPWGRRMDRQTDIHTALRKISPFYRTLSPIGTTAQKSEMVENSCKYIIELDEVLNSKNSL